MWPFKKRPPAPPEPENWEVRVRFKSQFTYCIICGPKEIAVEEARKVHKALRDGEKVLHIGWFTLAADDVSWVIPAERRENDSHSIRVAQIAAVREFAKAIEHGEPEHKEWLRNCVEDYANGRPIKLEATAPEAQEGASAD